MSSNDASAAFRSLLLSETIRVKLGAPDHPTTIKIHRKIFTASESPVLRSLVTKGWKEASDGLIDWTDAELPKSSSEDRLRLLEYLYIGDYSVPMDGYGLQTTTTTSVSTVNASKPLPKVQTPTINTPCTSTPTGTPATMFPKRTSNVGMVLRGQFLNPKEDDTGKCEPLKALSSCIAYTKAIPLTKSIAAGAIVQRASLNPLPSFSSLLFSHVRLYCLANQYLLHELKELCVYRLHITLLHITKQSDIKLTGEAASQRSLTIVKDITPLIKFVFEHTQSGLTGKKPNPMRTLMTCFCAHNSHISQHPVFHELLSAGGDFVVEYHKLLQEKLNYQTFVRV